MASHPSHHVQMRDLSWSPTEKRIARKAFEQALKQEFDSIVQETKEKAAKIEQPSDLWDLEAYLTDRRKEIDRKYDYRYSVLPIVFGRLIFEGRLSEQDLQGLREDKLDFVRGIVRLAEWEAASEARPESSEPDLA